MKKALLFSLLTAAGFLHAWGQVTQINSNRSLSNAYPISNTQAILVSETDQTLWVTDGTLAGTTQLSATIQHVENLGSTGFLNGKYIFAGTTAATGTELYITDGTAAGTMLVKDINPGTPNSTPGSDAAMLNGLLYFTAETPGEGRELWRTDGTLAGTTLVKDVVPGPLSSNNIGSYNLFSNGSYLLFAAGTPALGVELWKSDGTDAGTVVLADLNTGNGGADSSNAHSFYSLNNLVLFVATNTVAGEEVWRTDGTAGGTFQLADINAGPASSTAIDVPIIGKLSIFAGFHTFNGKAFFTAFNGTSYGVVWSTDGSQANTVVLKDIVSTPVPSLIFLLDAVNLPGKFIFPVSDLAGRSELWESDGTPAGTKLFKSFFPTEAESIPFILVPYAYVNGTVTQQLFQGGRFFFKASNADEGSELWISDGVDSTAAHTQLVEDINPGPGDGAVDTAFSYIYTSTGLYFPANNGTTGLELWKSDGTAAGTDIVADIVTGPGGSDPEVHYFLVNGKVLFGADNGDNPSETDLYVVEGTFTPVPVKLTDFTVRLRSADAHLQWNTEQEQNSKDFTIQRSFDGVHFETIGKQAAAGNSSNRKVYTFIDAGVGTLGHAMVYYRLLSADFDGKATMSPVIAQRLAHSGEWTVRVLANPVHGDLRLMLSGVKENIQLSILDLTGKKLYSNSMIGLNGQVSLPASDLPRGMYILVAETNNDRKIIRFVK
jgi:ELWxxDGT repeat protein